MDVEDLPPETDALYAANPEAFVAARNTLAKTLRAEKRREEANAVASLRRPTVAAWALNQVARRNPHEVDALLAAGVTLQTATARAVSGQRGDLRSAQDAQRKALDEVVEAALAAIKELGAGNVDQLRGRVTNTLHAAMADEQVADQLRRGRLDEDVDAPGFGFGFGAIVGDDDDDTDADEDHSAAEAAAQAERAAELARRQARVEELDAVARAAEDAARVARAEADAAKAALDELA